jgi:hypothetical protein
VRRFFFIDQTDFEIYATTHVRCIGRTIVQWRCGRGRR